MSRAAGAVRLSERTDETDQWCQWWWSALAGTGRVLRDGQHDLADGTARLEQPVRLDGLLEWKDTAQLHA